MSRENDLARIIVDAAYRVHSKLGPGLLESVYEKTLSYELKQRGLSVECQKPIPIKYGDIQFDEGFRADILVEDCVIIELKSVETIRRVHKKQILTYLRLADKRLGLLVNFGEALIKDGISRIVNELQE
jgi:GxxExxY protein